jgi:hypothetical protein
MTSFEGVDAASRLQLADTTMRARPPSSPIGHRFENGGQVAPRLNPPQMNGLPQNAHGFLRSAGPASGRRPPCWSRYAGGCDAVGLASSRSTSAISSRTFG